MVRFNELRCDYDSRRILTNDCTGSLTLARGLLQVSWLRAFAASARQRHHGGCAVFNKKCPDGTYGTFCKKSTLYILQLRRRLCDAGFDPKCVAVGTLCRVRRSVRHQVRQLDDKCDAVVTMSGSKPSATLSVRCRVRQSGDPGVKRWTSLFDKITTDIV